MKPLIVQSDLSIMLSTSEDLFHEVKNEIIKFAEITSSPDSIYIFKITSLSIWNAIALGVTKEFISETLNKYSKHAVPKNVIDQVNSWYKQYGVVELDEYDEDYFVVVAKNLKTRDKIKSNKDIFRLVTNEVREGFLIKKHYRGEIKHVLMKYDISVNDKLGFTAGEPLDFKMRDTHRKAGFEIKVRDYQEDSSVLCYEAGSGTVILPCGAGKTPTGLRFMILNQKTTLIVTNSDASVKQWKQTLLDFTTLKEDQISCYTAKNKVVAPVTICTYNMIAYRNKGEFPHFNNIIKNNWGTLVLDEVHLMPARLFRIVASFQASRRLALTATFVRGDGRERDIFTLIGPRRYDKPWKDLEARGYIAKVNLKELRIPLTKQEQKQYQESKTYQDKMSIAVMSKNKIEATKRLLEKHKGDKVLIIGQSTEQLEEFSRQLNIPVVHGKHTAEEREKYYDKMRNDDINELIASSIANAALDIPSINVVIQISFLGSSQNEEAQRVGRSTRPKEKDSFFYTIVIKGSPEEQQNFNRQKFLTGEGYKYQIEEMAMAS